MEYRLLGRSGLKVSTITMGTMTFGGSAKIGDTDLSHAQRQIDLCLDAGVNLIDTANVYSAGKSEQMIGEAMTPDRWKRALIATKVRFRVGDGPNDNGLSRWHIIRECEKSLKRLKAGVIDLYQVHQWDGSTPIEETMEALDTLVKDGKVRYAGCSNYSGWHIMKALAAAERHNYQRFVSQQIHYTLQAREAEYELVPISLDQGLGILVWSPIAGGLLSGKYRRNAPVPANSRHTGGHAEPPVSDWEHLYDIVDVLVAVGEAHGVSAAQVALAWLIQRPGVTSVIVGGRTEEQFRDNLAAADLKLTPEEVARLDEVSRPRLLYPYWHQNWSVFDRMSPPDLALHSGYPRPAR